MLEVERLLAADGAEPPHELLCTSCARGRIAAVRVLCTDSSVAAGASSVGKGGSSPLFLACRYGHEDCVRFLLDLDVDTTIHDHVTGASALQAACQEGHERIVQILLGAHSDDALGRRFELERIRGGMDFDACCGDYRGLNCLHSAARGGHESIVWLLLQTDGASYLLSQVWAWSDPWAIARRPH